MNYKQVEGYSDYIIFKTGKIFSKKRNRFLEPWDTKKSGFRIMLYKNKKGKFLFLHRLLGIAFIPNPLNLKEIDHIDRNNLNNDLSNLRWVNRSENSLNRGLQKNNKLGLRFIHKHTNRNLFVVHIPRLNYNKNFKTEEEAILQRNCLLDYYGEDYENIDV